MTDEPQYGLGRVAQFDPRSRMFAITTLAAKPLRSYTWSLPIVLNQGAEGACVGYAFAHELAAAPRKIPGVTGEHARSFYFGAQHRDQWDGGGWAGANPFYEGTSILAGAKEITAAGFYTGYRWAFTEDDMAQVVAYFGPVVIGVNWHADMFTPDSEGFLHPSGGVVGGHAILTTGINLAGDYYTVCNSWGPGWGRGGRARIRRQDMRKLLADEGECCVPVRVPLRKQPLLTAGPP